MGDRRAAENEVVPSAEPADVDRAVGGATGVDVAVIGAGISGLAVARSVLEGGRSVVVFESRERVGGRFLSRELGDGSGRVDLGATWFWPGEQRVAALVAEFELAVHHQHLAGDALFHQPGGGQRLDGNPIDVPSFCFTDGAQALPEAIASTLPDGTIRLGTRVDGIRGPGPFEVDHTGGTTSADHVVVALPPALAAARVGFDPPLRDRLAGLAAVTPVWMGSTVKVVVQFDRPFWREQGLAGSAISHLGPMREIHDMSGPDGWPAVLFGFVPSTGPGPAPTEASIQAQLIELFGPDAGHPTEIIIADWRAEADTSPAGVEALQAYQTFGHDVYQKPSCEGRLHWCSTETATVAPGHIEGALSSAERVAATILATDRTPPRQGVNR